MNELQNPFQVNLDTISPYLPIELQHPSVLVSLHLALAEDLSAHAYQAGDFSLEGDITSVATVPSESCLLGNIRAKAAGVVAGLPIARAVFSLLDEGIFFNPLVKEGDPVRPGMMLVELSGSGRSLFAGERTALNYLGRMSGIASLTRQFVDAVRGTRATILDTRKTAPGLRIMDKYAVRMGGGQNHRAGLYDMVMVKDNHITAAGGITSAVEDVRELFGSRYAIEVEVKNLVELDEVLNLQVERIMLDNMDLESMRNAVRIAGGRIPLEASGNVSLSNVRQIADTGVDFISSGSLTHSAPALDISMKIG